MLRNLHLLNTFAGLSFRLQQTTTVPHPFFLSYETLSNNPIYVTKTFWLFYVVHDKGRMPVILSLEAGLQFLEASLEERIAMCQTFPPDKMNSEPTEL